MAFLNRRVCKKTAAARKKELNYDKASGEKKKGIDEARGKENGQTGRTSMLSKFSFRRLRQST